MTINVNRPPPSVATTQSTAATSAANTDEMLSRKDLLSGGSFKIGVDGSSSADDVTAAFKRFSDGASAKGYATLAEGLGKDFKGKMLASVEQKMDTWLKGDGKNATKEQIATKAKEVMMNQTVLYQTMKSSITQMANDAISRMKDSFEG
jgi:hypothetical protein